MIHKMDLHQFLDASKLGRFGFKASCETVAACCKFCILASSPWTRASWACNCATCCWRAEIEPTQPYTGSLTLASASYARLLAASLLNCSGRSCSILATLLAPKTRCTLANLWGSSVGKYGAKRHSFVHRLLSSLQAAHGELVAGEELPPEFEEPGMGLPSTQRVATVTVDSSLILVAILSSFSCNM